MPTNVYSQILIYINELEQCRVKKLAQGFNTAAQDSNPGPYSRESEALPLSHCALQTFLLQVSSNSDHKLAVFLITS